jgi:heme oxygenase
VRQVAKTLVRLNVETRGFHAAADERWLKLVAPRHEPTYLDYVSQLVLAYGFDAPLEAAFAYTPELDTFIDLHPRFRSGLFIQDLLQLGLTPGQLASLRQCMIAPFTNVAEAFGWLYVHERTTLLMEPVRDELVSRLPDLAEATSALAARDGRVGMLWESFGEALDRVAFTSHIEDRIVMAATDAFHTLHNWHGASAHAARSRTRA